jgi:hypothetical protein
MSWVTVFVRMGTEKETTFYKLGLKKPIAKLVYNKSNDWMSSTVIYHLVI